METFKLELNYEQILVLQEAIDRARQLPNLQETIYGATLTSAEELFDRLLDGIEEQMDQFVPRLDDDCRDDKEIKSI